MSDKEMSYFNQFKSWQHLTTCEVVTSASISATLSGIDFLSVSSSGTLLAPSLFALFVWFFLVIVVPGSPRSLRDCRTTFLIVEPTLGLPFEASDWSSENELQLNISLSDSCPTSSGLSEITTFSV